ncbi:ABC transporter permease [Clostridium senegalense]
MNKKNIIDFTIIILIAPLLMLCIWSFTNSWPFPYMFPKKISLRGFEYLLIGENLQVLLISVTVSIVTTFITIIISIPAAKAITLYEFKGKKFFELLIISPIIVPLISIVMGVHIIFIKLGLANTMAGVIIINILPCIPYAVRIIGDVYKIVGDKFEMQAKMLGADRYNTFKYVTFPLILPGIIGAASMSFIISFSQYFLVLIIGGGNIVTYPIVMFPYIQSGDRTISALYSMVFLIVSIIVLILIEWGVKHRYNREKSFFD